VLYIIIIYMLRRVHEINYVIAKYERPLIWLLISWNQKNLIVDFMNQAGIFFYQMNTFYNTLFNDAAVLYTIGTVTQISKYF